MDSFEFVFSSGDALPQGVVNLKLEGEFRYGFTAR